MNLIDFTNKYILLKKFNSNCYNEQFWINKNEQELFEKLLKTRTDNESISELLYLSYYSKSKPKCENETCNNSVEFISFNKGYKHYCSPKCSLTSEKTKEKRLNTVNERYGVNNVSELKETKDKISKSNKISMNKDITQNKRKETNLKRYNDEYYNNRPKMIETSLNNIQDDLNSFQRSSIKRKERGYLNQYSNKFSYLDSLNDYELKELLTKHHNIEKLTLFEIGLMYKENKNKISELFKRLNIKVLTHSSSKQEKNVIEFLGENVISTNNRKILGNGKEIDIECNDFLIEYNGLYYHSNIDSNYHLDKTRISEEKGYQLFHIFENEWINENKQKIWKSVINSRLNKNKKIYARKCIVKEITTKEAKEFLNLNHLQGYSSSNYKIGLYYNNELVSVMTFGKPRMSKSYEYELIRFSSLLNYTIVGAGSKLLKYFERNKKPRSLISYANRRWSQGNFYEKTGFTFSHNSSPNMFWFNKDYILKSRHLFQKHKLKDIKGFKYNSELTAKENMFNNGYRVIYDSGNKVYYKEYKYN